MAAAAAARRRGPGLKKLTPEEKLDVLKNITSGLWAVQERQNASRKGVPSAAWERFGFVIDNQSKELQSFVKCFNCDTVRRWNHARKRQPTSSLISHKCVVASDGPATLGTATPTVQDRTDFKGACVDVMTGDLRASTTFCTPLFENLVQVTCNIQARHGTTPLNASLLLSDRTTLIRHMEVKANDGRAAAAEEMATALRGGVVGGATTDLWTDNFKHKHFMALTVHSIDKVWRLLNIILSVSQFKGDSESAGLLAEHLKQELLRFRIDSESLVFVTDGGKNLIKALEILNIKRIYCMDHCMNVILKSSFNMKLVDLDLFGEAGNSMFEWVSLAVTYTRTSRRRGKPNSLRSLKKPPTPCETSRRYASRVPCLESLLAGFDDVCAFLSSGGQQEIVDNLDKDKIIATISFLKPIDDKAKSHWNDLAEIDIDWLNNHIADQPEDSAYLRQLKENARVQLAGRHAVKLMQKCKEIVTLFKKWGENHTLDETLKQEIPTRWNSNLIMLMSFPRNFAQVNAILTEHRRADLVLSDADQTDIIALIKFLEPWKEQSDKVEGDKYPTLQYVLAAACRLEDHCLPNLTDNEKIRHLRARALHLLRQKFVPDDLHKVATFLWPDFRALKMLKTPAERRAVYDLAQQMMNKWDASGEPSRKRRKGGDGYDKWRTVPTDEAESDEIEEYLSANLELCPGDDLLAWWKLQAHRFTKLARLAQQVLSIPASSASSERAFSAAGLLYTCHRTSLSADHMDDMIFLRSFNRFKAAQLQGPPELKPPLRPNDSDEDDSDSESESEHDLGAGA